MASKLAPLHSHLSVLGRRRWLLRLARGGMALTLTMLIALAIDFLIDWLCSFGRAQRGVQLVTLAGLALWACRRFVWPAFVARETDIDLALLVERQQGIDSDLVAALQFETSAAPSWGSMQLEDAVVDYVADFGNSLKLHRGLTGNRLRRTALALAVTAVVLAVGVIEFPDHAAVFVNRLLLGSAHYPTYTTITRISINESEVQIGAPAAAAPRIPYGSAVRFSVDASGVCPASGSIRIVAQTGAGATSVMLLPTQSPADQTPSDQSSSERQPPVDSAKAPATAAGGNERATYQGDLPRLVATVSYQVYLGDGWTEPASIEVIPLPVVSLALDHTPPPYAARQSTMHSDASSRQISVIEGSQVVLTVQCSNKPLAKVEFVTGLARYPLEPETADRQVWKLPAAQTPLTRVVAPLPFEVQVVDDDGMSPEQPLRGHIRIETDRPPRIAAAVVTEKVLPGAHPGIAWGAADDYGLAEIRAHKQLTRGNGEIEQSVDVLQQIPAAEQPQPMIRGRVVLDLAPLSLSKGDLLRVTLEAVDYRGDHPGMSAQSEPVVFQVTDESGILAGLVEADEKSARQLDQIIQRQLGIGAAR